MSRKQRRRAERRRRGHRPDLGTGLGTPEPEVLRAALEELDRRTRSSNRTVKQQTGKAGLSATTTRAPEAPAAIRRTGSTVTQGARTTAASLSASSTGCSAVEDAEPQALGLTYTFDAAADGEPYSLTIGFEGRRTGSTGPPGPRDSFRVIETITDIVPGSRRISITRRIPDIAPGDWVVAAGPVVELGEAAPDARSLPAPARASGSTGFAPIIRIRAPGARLGAWPALVATGAAVALAVQAMLAARAALPVVPVLLLSLIACLAGLAGARLYYRAEHPGQPRGLMNTTGGMCVQGFVLAAVATVVVGALLVGLPVGRLLDFTVPGLLFGMAIGRVGCFFGGCCAGRPTASRWGLWSSDRRLGTRRIPIQLFESAMALVLGLVVLLVMLTAAPAPGGLVFAGGIAAYTLGRQLLFPLREQPRNTRHGRALAMAASGAVLVGVIVISVLG